ncbi:MAG: MATE family efflux transporter [Clostridiales bacterium]|nr:MATE family efflux transporter [Clostridiales bacterium]
MRITAKPARSTLMTEGPIARQLIAFALPLMLGNLFQQLYNTADSLIVGNFLGSDALAAVSSSSNLIQLMVGFFNGVAGGAGVVIARYYGARDIPRLQRTLHTMMAFGLAAGCLLTAAGVTLTPILLRLMGTPETVLPQSISYFRTYFLGSMAFVLYNICMGALQAVGDSRHPLQYLMISSVINVALDLLFVGVLGWGVAAAAAATAISQTVSTVLCLIRLTHSDRDYRLNLRRIRFDLPALREILSNGVPSGLANCIISIANVVVQANINAFGAAAMAGCGAHSRIEGFAFLPVTCFNMALTTFVSQNLGARRYDRVKKGARIGLVSVMVVAESIALMIYILSPRLIGLFSQDPEVIAFGVMHQRTTTPFFFLLAYTHAMAAIQRGAGHSAVAMLVMAVCWCVIRVPYVTLAAHLRPVLTSVSSGYPVTWTLSSIVFTIYYFKTDWMHSFERHKARS